MDGSIRFSMIIYSYQKLTFRLLVRLSQRAFQKFFEKFLWAFKTSMAVHLVCYTIAAFRGTQKRRVNVKGELPCIVSNAVTKSRLARCFVRTAAQRVSFYIRHGIKRSGAFEKPLLFGREKVWTINQGAPSVH